MKTAVQDAMFETFGEAPAAYGPVALWWWNGEALDRERLAWQLDRLAEAEMMHVCVCYAKTGDDGLIEASPTAFTPEWLEIWDWTAAQCAERGMTLGFCDYVWIDQAQERLAEANPEFRGWKLTATVATAHPADPVSFEAMTDTQRIIAAYAWPGVSGPYRLADAVMLSPEQGTWRPEADEWTVLTVRAERIRFDPMNRQATEAIIGTLYAVFDRPESGARLGGTLDYFFQDELSFGGEMPYWNDKFEEAFREQTGYGLIGALPALWLDVGEETARVRLDYYDVAIGLMEACYYKPIYEWHAARGTLYGHDQWGRQSIIGTTKMYGDYFRTMRWYSAPGYDDFGGAGRQRNFKDGKLASSVAHLNGRSRVWVEAFHSAGWGMTPAEMTSWLNENFAFGATLYNAHGLYYSTYGGWFEWAPPDPHFRQPYWAHMTRFNRYVARMCYMLSQGEHRCEIAVMMPISSVQAGIGQEKAESDCYGLAEKLFYGGLNLDFADETSLASASVADGRLLVAGASYRILVLPSIGAMRQETLEKLAAFRESGGIVIAYGRLPEATDRGGSADPALTSALARIFGGDAASGGEGAATSSAECHGYFVQSGYDRVREIAERHATAAFRADRPGLLSVERRVGARRIFYLYNATDETLDAGCTFPAAGAGSVWDAWTGEVSALSDAVGTADGTKARLRFAPREAQLVVFDIASDGDSDERSTSIASVDAITPERCSAAGHESQLSTVKLPLGGEWEVRLVPLLDNRYGDFRLPASGELIGGEAASFVWRPEHEAEQGWMLPDYDDADWVKHGASYGPAFRSVGDFAPGDESSANEARSLLNVAGDAAPGNAEPIAEWASARGYTLSAHAFSREWGIERDPMQMYLGAGPFGLKKRAFDTFLDFGYVGTGRVLDPHGPGIDQPASDIVPRSGRIAWTDVLADEDAVRILYLEAMVYEDFFPARPRLLPVRAWLNGVLVAEASGEYEVRLRPGRNRLVLELQYPANERLRAYAVIAEHDAGAEVEAAAAAAAAEAEAEARAGAKPLRWSGSKNWHRSDSLGRDAGNSAGLYRFAVPPGIRSLRFAAFAREAEAWIGGESCAAAAVGETAEGATLFEASLAVSSPRVTVAALRIPHPPGYAGGMALPEPVKFVCEPGFAELADWREWGLAAYSGAIRYSRRIELPPGRLVSSMLSLGDVSACAQVFVNGAFAGAAIAPPWTVDLTEALQQGGVVQLEIEVANTAANHWLAHTPTMYAYPGQDASGLTGPVSISCVYAIDPREGYEEQE
ncbi:hypothetical protein GZH47_11150 [Paenibacillus rhizovicinus]|uniref:Glycosyl hydrolases family 2 sugar binding domain-containing protein n=1 Tax=Paenibacillus rhizovicinus TaxID=2704463 RepID=A0A6C0NZI2_9BACL|nr:glycosyl hydrolase [Paenibacillus rhizovicinus]QHW31346.1 hypothetical protein GZH47_11150 [Paenibacillus rhizovicinus]